MRKSSRQVEKPANEAQIEPEVKKRRSDNRISKIAAMDNDTMVEAFKFFNYCQLAKSSHVSKKFRNLIQTHRNSLALLDVDYIFMTCFIGVPKSITMFDKELPPEDYNEWVIRNNFSKQIPPASGKQSALYVRKVYRLSAVVGCKDSNLQSYAVITVFSAQTLLNDENWPLFQHFVRLLTDPFIYIRDLELSFQINVFDLLTGAISQDRGRLQCGRLRFTLDCKTKKFLNWIKDHVRCNELNIDHPLSPKFDKVFLDLVMTGAQCSPKILFRDISTVVADIVQKFMGLKSCDESQIVHSIRGLVSKPVADALKSDYEKFFVKEEKHGWHTVHIIRHTVHVFEFANVDIGKKFQLTVISRKENLFV